ncbi:hypothetical protein Tco_0608657 [Tanacetum coccineum]
MGVDSDISDVRSEDSDPTYQLSKDEDDISDSISLAQDDDNDDDDYVSTLSHTINDPFLTQLCYDNMDDDVVEQVDSDEDMSANEENEDIESVEKYIERVNDYKRLLVRYGKEEIDYEDDGIRNNNEREEIGVGNNDEKEEDGGENNDEKEADGGKNNDEKQEDGVENNDEKGENGVDNRILEAVKDIFPYAKHRQCTQHIYSNFKKKFHGIQFRNLFWAVAYSTTEQHFEDKMKELKAINNDAYNNLIERNPQKKDAKLEHELCPSIRKILEEIEFKQRHWSVIPSDYNVIEARNEYSSFVLQKDMFKEAYKYPIRPLKGSSFLPKTNEIEPLPPKERRMPGRPPVDRKRDASEKKIMYSKKQKTDVLPKEVSPRGRSKRIVAATSMRASTSGAEVGDEMLGSLFLPKTNEIEPLPPKERRMPGRPPVDRKRDASKKKIKYSKVEFGRRMPCQKCHGKGHNLRSCKKQKINPLPKEVRPRGRSKRIIAAISKRASTSGAEIGDEMLGH